MKPRRRDERRREWAALVARAKKVRDPTRWKMKIDEPILGCVVGLWAHGIPTSTSCAGHADLPHTYPRVFVCDMGDLDHTQLADKEYWSPKRVNERLAFALKNREYQATVLRLLGEFHDARRVSADARVQVNPVIEHGWFSVMNAGGDVLRLLSDRARVKRLATYQLEMRRFARFLEKRFLAGTGGAPRA